MERADLQKCIYNSSSEFFAEIAAGISHIKPNELGRHFFGTHAVNDLGADIYPVQSWLGHTDPKTTERYAKMRPIPIARILDPKAKAASEVPQAKKQPRK